MNLKNTSFFLGMILSAAAPAFADKIPADLHQDGITHYTQLSADENGAAARFGTDDTKFAELGVLADSRPSASSTEIAFFVPRSNHGDALGRDNYYDRDQHKGRRRPDVGDGPLSSVAASEPSTRLLLVFGLAGLGMLVYRRNSVQQAI